MFREYIVFYFSQFDYVIFVIFIIRSAIWDFLKQTLNFFRFSQKQTLIRI